MTDQSTGTPTPVTSGAIPWYRSPIYIAAMTAVLGAITTLYPKAAAVLHITTPIEQTAWIELAGGLVTLAGGAFIWIMCQINKFQPITLTKEAAIEHPSTVAVVKTQQLMADAGIQTAVTLQAQLTKETSK